MDEQILGTLVELERKLAELERTIASLDRSAPVSEPAGEGEREELLGSGARLERTAGELTNDYNELLARLNEPPPAPAPASATISFARGAPSLDIIDVEGLRDAAVRALESDPG